MAAVVPALLSAVLAVLATRPKLAAKVFGPGERRVWHPSDLELDSTDVEYRPGSQAWWIPAPAAVGAVVIVHGYEPTIDPRSTDPGPRLELASMLHTHGFASLIVNLGYASGSHLHSGGALEADDIADGVEWVRNRSGLPVAVIGFSAGGHASIAATSRCSPFAVVTDSSFVDFSEVATDQGSLLLRLPRSVFGLTTALMRLMTGHRPINLESDLADIDTPMLHIHGDADTAISHQNLQRIAAVTGGETYSVAGADHVDGFRVDPIGYEAALIRFLTRAVASERPGTP
ncbi:MAG: alpha/beta hydrolase [Actinomycetota bacterium]